MTALRVVGAVYFGLVAAGVTAIAVYVALVAEVTAAAPPWTRHLRLFGAAVIYAAMAVAAGLFVGAGAQVALRVFAS